MSNLRMLREEWRLCPLLLVNRLQAFHVVRLDAIQPMFPLVL
jgi:hypothetical protein